MEAVANLQRVREQQRPCESSSSRVMAAHRLRTHLAHGNIQGVFPIRGHHPRPHCPQRGRVLYHGNHAPSMPQWPLISGAEQRAAAEAA